MVLKFSGSSAEGMDALPGEPAVTIFAPTSGGCTFEAQLEEDEWHMLWLNTPNLVTVTCSRPCSRSGGASSASPDEQTMLEAHGFGSRRVQSRSERRGYVWVNLICRRSPTP